MENIMENIENQAINQHNDSSEQKFVVSPIKTILSLSFNVILFFLSVIFGLIVFDSRQIWFKAAFVFLGLVFVGLSFVSYRIFSGSYFIQILGKNLILSKTFTKIAIPMDSIEKFDLVKGKSLFKGDDSFKIEYKKGKDIVKTNFLLFYLKENSDKIYSQIVSHLEKNS
jgi:hypothetical protein